YQPLYIPRPTVEPDLFASLRPPTYSGALTNPAAVADAGRPAFGGFPGAPGLPQAPNANPGNRYQNEGLGRGGFAFQNIQAQGTAHAGADHRLRRRQLRRRQPDHGRAAE